MSGITSELNSINLSATTNQIHSASTDSEVPHIQSLINSYQPLSALLRRDLAGQDDETQTPELEKVSISNYEQESNEKNRAEEIKLFKEKMLAEMQETGELVEKDHPLYQEMHGFLFFI